MIAEFWPQGERERGREGGRIAVLHLSVKVAAMTCRLFMAKYNRRTPLGDLVVSCLSVSLNYLIKVLAPSRFCSHASSLSLPVYLTHSLYLLLG